VYEAAARHDEESGIDLKITIVQYHTFVQSFHIKILTCLHVSCLHLPPKQTLPASDFHLLIIIATGDFTNMDGPPTRQSFLIRLFRGCVIPRLRPFVHRDLAELGACCAGRNGIESFGAETLVMEIGERRLLWRVGVKRKTVVSQRRGQWS